MPALDTSSFCRVLIIAPTTRVDVALPTDIAVVDLMPYLLDMVGERSDDGGALHDGWQLSRAGGQALDLSRSIRAQDITDGSALRLTHRQPVQSAPIYDDVVDAIASRTRESLNDRSIIEAGATTIVVTMLLLAGLVAHALPRGVLTVAVSVVLMVLTPFLARALIVSLGHRRLGTVVGVAGALQAFLTGMTVVGGPVGAPAVLLGVAFVLAYAVVCLVVLRTGTRYFFALAVTAVLVGGGALARLLSHAGPDAATAGVVAVAVGLLANAPWLSLRLARLPLPLIPTTEEDLSSPELNHDFGRVRDQAAVALEYQEGAVTSCSLVAGAGAGLVAGHGTGIGLGLGAVVAAVLLLRTRTLIHLPHRVALMVGALTVMVVAVTRLVLHPGPELSVVAVPVLLAIGVAAFVVLVVVPRQRTVNPMLSRSLDLLEAFALGAVMPLAAWVMGLYSYVRHW